MPFFQSPEVKVIEKDYALVINGVSTSSGALVAALGWGPVDRIMTLSSENELVFRTGKPTDDTFEGFFAAADFLSYSDNLKLIRVIGARARNATSGGVGSGLTVNTVVLNGQVQSVTIADKGTKYIVGDLIHVVGGLTPSILRVTDISNGGLVDGMEMLVNGTGYTAAGLAATTVVTNTLVRNDDDFDDSVYMPEIVAKYPGILGNNLMFSSVRASEFDNWRYRSRFVVPPVADVIKFSATGKQKVFPLTAALPADAIVTVDGFTIESGANPGFYTATGTTLTFNTDTETFVASGTTNLFTLVNTGGITTRGAVVKLAGTEQSLYLQTGPVPFGSVRVSGNTVEFGIKSYDFNGDGATRIFTVVGAADTGDAKIKVDGTYRTKITTGVPTAAQVLVEVVDGNTVVTFPAGLQPGIGKGNIVLEWKFPVAAASVAVEYGFPPKGAENVKVFSKQNQMHVVVADRLGGISGEPYSILERFVGLSTNPAAKSFDGTSNYYRTVLNRGSQWIRVSSDIKNHDEKVLTGAVDDNVYSDFEGVTPGILQQGYSLFRDSEEVDISHVIGRGADKPLAVYLINDLVEYRKDCVAYLSPPRDLVVQNRGFEVPSVTAFKRDLPSSSYYHFDGNWKYRYDPYNDKFRWVSCAADSAGCYAQTADDVDPWVSGAGFNRGRIKNVIKLAWSPNKTARDELYAHNINPIYQALNEGPILFGDKTGQTKPSAFDRMNVRWLFIVLEKSIARAAKYYLFENNTEFTRNRFRNMVIPFLRDVKGRDGLEDFRVVCDEKNNPESVRARNEFVGDILIKPAYSINFITLNFVAVGPNVTFDEVESG